MIAVAITPAACDAIAEALHDPRSLALDPAARRVATRVLLGAGDSDRVVTYAPSAARALLDFVCAAIAAEPYDARLVPLRDALREGVRS